MFSKGLAGIQPADFPGIENVRTSPSILDLSRLLFPFPVYRLTLHCNDVLQVDVTELIEGHSSYMWAAQGILDRLELDTYYPIFRIPPSRNSEKTP